MTGVPVDTGVTVLVIVGTRSPIRMRAFSLLRARMRGLANRLASESSSFKFSVALRPVALSAPRVRLRRPLSVFALVGVEMPKLLGNCSPMLLSRSRETSSTSTSSITSASGTSCAAITLVATAIASGVSRITSVLLRSSTDTSLILSTDFSTDIRYFASALETWKVRTCRSWYSFCLAGVAG